MAVALVVDEPAPGNPTTGWTQTLSALIADGHDVFVLVESRNHNAGTALPSVSDNGGGNSYVNIGASTDRRLTLWHKKATAGTGGSTLTVSGCVQVTAGGYFVFSGADATTPYTNLSVETDDNTSHAGFTPSAADSMIVLCTGNTWSDRVTLATCTNPGSLEPELWEHVSQPGNRAMAWVGAVLQSGGPTATGDFTWTSVPDAIASIAFAVQPAGGGGGPSGLSIPVAMRTYRNRRAA